MMGYRSRAAFKLEELDKKFNLIKKDSLVVDLGCAPGGWVQIALLLGAERVVGIDILPCLLYTSPSPRDGLLSRMPSSA